MGAGQSVIVEQVGDWLVCEDAMGIFYHHTPTQQSFDNAPNEFLVLFPAGHTPPPLGAFATAGYMPVAQEVAYAAPVQEVAYAAPVPYATSAEMVYAGLQGMPQVAYASQPVVTAAPVMMEQMIAAPTMVETMMAPTMAGTQQVTYAAPAPAMQAYAPQQFVQAGALPQQFVQGGGLPTVMAKVLNWGISF